MSTSEHYVCSLDTLDWQVAQEFEANFRWEYADGRDKLLNLYRKGKRQQWDSDERIDWSQDLDPENPAGLILADIVKADRRRAGEIIDRLRALFKGGQVSLQKLSLNAVIEKSSASSTRSPSVAG